MITINELFSGIGAQVAALKRLGIEYETVGIAEINRFAIQSYEAINGKTRNYGDISKVEKLDYADLWTYSSPCQDFSIAGRQKGIYDENGEQTRSGLLLQVERLLKTAIADGKAPKYLLFENVKNLVGKKFRPDFDKWINTLEELGYNNYWKVLNSKDYGVPQNRERVFAVSIRKDIDDGEFKFPEKIPLERRLKDVLETNVDEKFYLKKELCDRFIEKLKKRDVSNTIRCGGSGSVDEKHTWDLVAEPSIVQNPHGYNNGGIIKDNVAPTMTSNGSYHLNNFVCNEPQIKLVGNAYYPDKNYGTGYAGATYDSSGIAATLTTMGGGNREPFVLEKCYSDGVRIRKLTPKECWRLMDFTDEEYEAAQNAGVSNTQLYKQAGNSIVVSVLSGIFNNLLGEQR